MWKTLRSGGAQHVWAPQGTKGIVQEMLLFPQPQIQHVSKNNTFKRQLTPISHPSYSQRLNTADICTNFVARVMRERTLLKSRWPPSSTFLMNQKYPFAHTGLLSKHKLPVFLPSTSSSLLQRCFAPFPARSPTSWSRCLFQKGRERELLLKEHQMTGAMLKEC